jgi:hypothetical protein
MGCLYVGGRGSSGHEISCLSESLSGVGYMRGPCCYQAVSKLKYSCVIRVHTLYISYFMEHNGDDEPRVYLSVLCFRVEF